MAKFSEGQEAPDFELMDDAGKSVKLSDYRGRKVILYFYPESFTPGCTTEACNFRDDFASYEDLDVTILGVSPDPVEDQARFRAEYRLPFSLLADPEHQVASLYGVWGRKLLGVGVLRRTFLIDENGRFEKIYERVDPKGHSRELLDQLTGPEGDG